MDETIQDIIDFFYANKHMFEAMHGKPDTRRLDNFVEQNCKVCGNHRCDPYAVSWRSSCPNWQSYEKL